MNRHLRAISVVTEPAFHSTQDSNVLQLGLGRRSDGLLLVTASRLVDSVHSSALMVVDGHDEVLEDRPREQVH